jgi:hypothetical protein
MKILVDEHIPLMTVKALREAQHDVRDIRGTADEGMADTGARNISRTEVMQDKLKRLIGRGRT